MFHKFFETWKEPDIQEEITTIYHAKCYSPQQGDFILEVSFDDWLFREKPSLEQDFPERKTCPKSPLSRFKDERRNELMNAFWDNMRKSGILYAIEAEKNYRLGKIQTLTAINDYPLKHAKGKKGVVYHEKFLYEFPESIVNAWKPKLEDGWNLCSLQKLPILLRSTNFILLNNE